jgi:hypothetical protein
MSAKINRIELDKTRGLTVQVVNGVNTQTIFLDGDKLTITVAGPAGTSTIEQTPTTVTVTADSFIVNARTISATGSEAATLTSGASSVALTSKAAAVTSPEIDLTGSTKLDASAPKIALTGTEAVTLSAVAPLGELSLNGGNVTITAETAMELGAPNLALMGMVEYLPLG